VRVPFRYPTEPDHPFVTSSPKLPQLRQAPLGKSRYAARRHSDWMLRGIRADPRPSSSCYSLPRWRVLGIPGMGVPNESSVVSEPFSCSSLASLSSKIVPVSFRFHDEPYSPISAYTRRPNPFPTWKERQKGYEDETGPKLSSSGW